MNRNWCKKEIKEIREIRDSSSSLYDEESNQFSWILCQKGETEKIFHSDLFSITDWKYDFKNRGNSYENQL